jgi:succinate dehydrogenase hydrophobic anchor subunit
MNLAANFTAVVLADCYFFNITFVLFIELADLRVRQFAAMPTVSLFTLLLLFLAAAHFNVVHCLCVGTLHAAESFLRSLQFLS